MSDDVGGGVVRQWEGAALSSGIQEYYSGPQFASWLNWVIASMIRG
jgi:hypothetical protein